MALRESEPVGELKTPLARIRDHPLPEESIRWVESYEEIVDDRDRFLWKWAHHLFPKFTLSCVAPGHVEEIQESKLVGLMFVSILDDVAEKYGDLATFEEAAKIPFECQSVDRDRDGVDRELLSFAGDLWEQLSPTLRDSPRATEFEGIVQFDLEQVINAMKYSYLANQNVEFATGSELRTYDAHNMMLFGFADIDLVHSPAFDRSELSTLRQVIERAQRMVRIGNWVTTWERELHEGDITSGIVVYALDHGVVSADDLRSIRDGTGTDIEKIVESIRDSAVEDVFLAQWHEELAVAREFEGQIESVDVKTYLDGIETVMEYHLASRGLK